MIFVQDIDGLDVEPYAEILSQHDDVYAGRAFRKTVEVDGHLFLLYLLLSLPVGIPSVVVQPVLEMPTVDGGGILHH